jgi:hypothetical protein
MVFPSVTAALTYPRGSFLGGLGLTFCSTAAGL